MNKKLLISGVAGIAALTGIVWFSYAQQVTSSDTTQPRHSLVKSKWMMERWWMWLWKFIDIDSLTAEQKTAYEALQKSHQEEMKALFDKKDSLGEEEFKTQIEALQKSHLEDLKGYVSSDKLEEFEELITSGNFLKWPGMERKGMMWERGEFKGGFGRQQWNFALFKVFNDKLQTLDANQIEALKTSLDAKISALWTPTDETAQSNLRLYQSLKAEILRYEQNKADEAKALETINGLFQ